MTPYDFITKWRASAIKERSAAQEHFIDLCHLLGESTPAEADPAGDAYCFERGARKDTGGDGWADVCKRHHFAWEYKGKHADLDAAFGQLRLYALALENPPLLIVSDMLRLLMMRELTGIGTPRSLQGRARALLDALIQALSRRWRLVALSGAARSVDPRDSSWIAPAPQRHQLIQFTLQGSRSATAR